MMQTAPWTFGSSDTARMPIVSRHLRKANRRVGVPCRFWDGSHFPIMGVPQAVLPAADKLVATVSNFLTVGSSQMKLPAVNQNGTLGGYALAPGVAPPASLGSSRLQKRQIIAAAFMDSPQ